MKRLLILSILLSAVIIVSCEMGVENRDVLSMNVEGQELISVAFNTTVDP